MTLRMTNDCVLCTPMTDDPRGARRSQQSFVIAQSYVMEKP